MKEGMNECILNGCIVGQMSKWNEWMSEYHHIYHIL